MSDAVAVPAGDLLQHLDNIDLTGVDTSRPIVKPGTYGFVVKSMEPSENKAKTGHNINIGLAALTALPTEDGKTVNPGFVVFDLVSLVATDKYNPLERLAKIQEGIFGEKRQGFKPAEMIGQNVSIAVGVEDSAEFGKKNVVKRWIPKKPTV